MTAPAPRKHYRYSHDEKAHIKRWGNIVLFLLLIAVLLSIYAYIRYDGLGINDWARATFSGDRQKPIEDNPSAKYDYVDAVRENSGNIFDNPADKPPVTETPKTEVTAPAPKPEMPVVEATPKPEPTPPVVESTPKPTPAPEPTPQPEAPVVEAAPKPEPTPPVVNTPAQPVTPTPEPAPVESNPVVDGSLPAPFQSQPLAPAPTTQPTAPEPVQPATPPAVVATPKPQPTTAPKPTTPKPVASQPISSDPSKPRQLTDADLGTPLGQPLNPPKPAAPAPRPAAASAPAPKPEPKNNAPATNASGGAVSFQVGSYSNRANAESMRANLAFMGINSSIVSESGKHRVVTERSSGATRQNIEQALQREGISYFPRN